MLWEARVPARILLTHSAIADTSQVSAVNYNAFFELTLQKYKKEYRKRDWETRNIARSGKNVLKICYPTHIAYTSKNHTLYIIRARMRTRLGN